MLPKLRDRLTFANVVSVLALFVALGGTSYAAIKITGKNVKDSSLTGKDIKNSSLTTSDVKNRSLLSKDFKSGQLPAGPRGADGTNGTNGFGVLSYPFDTFSAAPGEDDPGTAAGGSGTAIGCPAGTFPTGGDAYALTAGGDLVLGVIVGQGIDFTGATPDGYFAAWHNPSTTDTVTVSLDAACANASTVQSKAKRVHVQARRLR